MRFEPANTNQSPHPIVRANIAWNNWFNRKKKTYRNLRWLVLDFGNKIHFYSFIHHESYLPQFLDMPMREPIKFITLPDTKNRIFTTDGFGQHFQTTSSSPYIPIGCTKHLPIQIPQSAIPNPGYRLNYFIILPFTFCIVTNRGRAKIWRTDFLN